MKLGEIIRVEETLKEFTDTKKYGDFATSDFLKYTRQDIQKRNTNLSIDLMRYLEKLKRVANMKFTDNRGRKVFAISFHNAVMKGDIKLQWINYCYDTEENRKSKKVKVFAITPIKFVVYFRPV